MSNIAGIHLSFGNESRYVSRRPQMSSWVVDWSLLSPGRWIGHSSSGSILLLGCLGRSVECAGPQRIVRNVDESLSVSV
jgi:hypothetical protein